MRNKSPTRGKERIGASGPVCYDSGLDFQIWIARFEMVDLEQMDDNGDVWKVEEYEFSTIGSIQLPQFKENVAKETMSVIVSKNDTSR